MMKAMGVMAALLVAAPLAAQGAPAAKAAQAAPGVTVKVNGLVCDFCVQAITRNFRKQAAVASVQVDLDAKEVRLGFKAGQTMADAAIRDLIVKSGYNVVAIARTGAA
jgi:copper chaperone CopZ